MEEANNVSVNYEEILEQMYGEMQEQTRLLTELKEQETSILDKVVQTYKECSEARYLLGVVLALYLVSFCWSCMRQWRKNLLGGSK